jgi:hypothetical protein
MSGLKGKPDRGTNNCAANNIPNQFVTKIAFLHLRFDRWAISGWAFSRSCSCSSLCSEADCFFGSTTAVIISSGVVNLFNYGGLMMEGIKRRSRSATGFRSPLQFSGQSNRQIAYYLVTVMNPGPLLPGSSLCWPDSLACEAGSSLDPGTSAASFGSFTIVTAGLGNMII